MPPRSQTTTGGRGRGISRTAARENVSVCMRKWVGVGEVRHTHRRVPRESSGRERPHCRPRPRHQHPSGPRKIPARWEQRRPAAAPTRRRGCSAARGVTEARSRCRGRGSGPGGRRAGRALPGPWWRTASPAAGARSRAASCPARPSRRAGRHRTPPASRPRRAAAAAAAGRRWTVASASQPTWCALQYR